MIDAEAIAPLLRAWLPTQRWFAGKGREVGITVEPLAPLSSEVELWLAQASYADGHSELYQVPLVSYPAPVDSLEHVSLGTISGADGLRWVYDALHDKGVTPAWLVGIREQTERPPLRFTRNVEPAEIPVDEPSLVLTGEQSNTSLMFGDVAMLKVFRRLQAGVNPDIEIHAALTARGATHVARLFGSVEADLHGSRYALAMLAEFMTTATDGWELAKASVRDLMAEADLHADEAGGDFAGEAQRLGASVAEVHAELADAFGLQVAQDLGERAAGMHARLDQAITVVPALAGLAGGLREAYDALGKEGADLGVQRIHGDLHLGQALRTMYRWVIIDFEGEPMSELAARRIPDSPLRDVAGMLRSFEYAGHHRVTESGYGPQLAYRASEWTERNRDAFCAGYAEAAGTDPRAQAVPLRAFEADKAVYEAVYEARNRPAWLEIPLASLARLATGGTGGGRL